MIAVATGDEIAHQLLRLAIFSKADRGFGGFLRIIEIVDTGVSYFKMNLAAGREPRVGEVFHHFMLRVDRDSFSAGEVREIDAMRAPAETQIHSVMNKAFVLEAFADAGFHQQIHCALFENTGAHTFLNVLAAAIFEHDGFDAVEVK